MKGFAYPVAAPAALRLIATPRDRALCSVRRRAISTPFYAQRCA